MKISDFRVGVRFLITFSLITLIAAGSMIYLMYTTTMQKKEVETIYKIRLIGIEKLIEADRDAYQSSIAICKLIGMEYAGKITDEFRNAQIKEVEENADQVNERFSAFSSLYKGSGGPDSEQFGIMAEHYSQWKLYSKQIVELVKADKFSEALALYEGEYAKEFKIVRNAMDVLTGVSLDLTEEEYAFFSKTYMRNLVISVASALVTIIIMVLTGVMLTRSISRPISRSIALAEKMAKGDLSDRLDSTGKDEFGDLARSLNDTADGLERLISEIKFSAANLADAVLQIAEGNNDLSKRTSNQAAALEEIASILNQASDEIRGNAESATQSDSLARETMTMAEDGNAVVTDAVNSINEINKSSKKIGEIISLIDEISFQTNLLALNAAVEAARAGEQGRGFAVVAGEVRNLAQRSANASREISGLIKESVNKITVGTDLANQSGESLRNIVQSIGKVAELISNVKRSSIGQLQGIEQVNSAVSQLNTMTQQNSALVEEIASSSEEMSAQAEEFKGMVGRFKLREK